MLDLFSAYEKDPQIALAKEALTTAGSQKTLVYGLTGAQKSFLIAAAYQKKPQQMLVVTPNEQSLTELHADLTSLLPEAKILILPPLDIVTFAAAAKSIELSAARLDVLSRLLRGEELIVLAESASVLQKTASREDFLNSRVSLQYGEAVNRADIITSLVNFGYERVDETSSPGQFSVRGGILDVFAINADLPVRAEFFGDEIDSLREFDPNTQRSVKEIKFRDVLPFLQPEIKGRAGLVFSYLEQDAAVIFDEPGRVREKAAKIIKENSALKPFIAGWEEAMSACEPYNTGYLSLLLQKIPNSETDAIIGVTGKSIAPFHRQLENLVDELKRWHEQKYATVILMSGAEKTNSLKTALLAEKIPVIFDTVPQAGKTLLATLALSGGFELPHAKLVIISEIDIFGRQKKKRLLRPNKEQRLSYFRDINTGDYIVHVNHGIGKYVGVKTIETGGILRDYLHIKYAGDDKLYVPVDQVGLLQKYVGSEGDVPRLNRMGGSDWLKTKTRAKTAVTDLAKELLHLYAKRSVQTGFAFSEDTPWQREFEDAFQFEETQDQLLAVAEVKKDMEKAEPMDRLLCGDVGFGKTEVAIRAAFKATLSGKQVAVLVPTTVLAQQHYQTFKDRFEKFGAVVDVISRFRSAREQKATLKKLAEGKVDVIIGTHRLLQKDVHFKDVGLLIVDEEQRFGVAQKEKLKQWQQNLDVLSLSATPIPRTLHMSLTGVRDMSIIETPPEDRYPVQSYVVEYSEEIIRDAISRELRRGGQVFFVYNRVASIDKMSDRLREILPGAAIQTVHGQMPEEILEKVMLDFYEGATDVLVCTSIIENGLDVSNANTIIIYDADHLGLSQLYQMRGRVGRSKRLAYAYFTYRQNKILTEVAEKRLQAVKEFAELGSGFKIAMRDLEIRGAGSLLGGEQHGHIVNVGFEMYCRLLEDAVKEMRGEEIIPPPPEPSLNLDINAYLPGDYIQDAMHKMEIYQKLAAAKSEADLVELADELIDRFGDLPEPVQSLIQVVRVKNLARDLNITLITEKNSRLELVFATDIPLSPDALTNLRNTFKGKLNFSHTLPRTIRISTAKINESVLAVSLQALTILKSGAIL
ncbi:MAG: transcription-repair coupling factor [Sporomusaceae bacterium]|jgi:transcription-repair coupling factor (superfamily II helicase)|nr:transcription-repair coupling factor [Sporomusaceae bacterium]